MGARLRARGMAFQRSSRGSSQRPQSALLPSAAFSTVRWRVWTPVTSSLRSRSVASLMVLEQ